MGITCKPYGKHESTFKKLDYQLKKDKEALKRGSAEPKKSKKSAKKED